MYNMDIDYETFIAARIADLREKKGVSAREMSLAIGQNSSYINRIENGLAFPSMQAFFYICEYLDISPQDFFDVENPAPEQMQRILARIARLTDEQRNALMVLLPT